MKKILFILSIVLTLKSHAQHAIVCDSLTKQPLPMASIKVKNTNLGTVTNDNGRFSISTKKGILIFSYIGYKTKEYTAVSLPDTVFLSENNQLNEVVVMPDSALKVLLRNAYNNISKNYPQKPTFLTGFYREVGENTDSSRFNYFSESVLKIYKPAYTPAGSEHQGQVKVLKTRKVLHPQYEKDGVRFYAGPYSAINDDGVLKRRNYINPKYFKSYNYEIEKITSYENRPVYVIKYSYKDSLMDGKIYIDKNTLAYLKFENYLYLNKKEAFITRIDTKSQQIYDFKDNMWYLKYDKYEGNFKQSKENFKMTVEYVTIDSQTDSVKSFSFDEQFDYTSVISRSESNISDDFFKEYGSVLEQKDELKNQVNLTFKTNTIDSLRNTITTKVQVDTTGKITDLKEKSKFDYKKIRSKLTMSFGINYAPINSFDYTFNATLLGVFKEEKKLVQTTKSSNIPILVGVNWRYQFNKRWAIMSNGGNTAGRWSNTYIVQRDWGLAYRFVVNPAKKPLFIEPSLKYTNLIHGISFGTFKNPERGITVDDKKLSMKNLNSGLFQQTQGIKLGLSANIYSRKTRKLFLGIDYLHPIKTSEPFFELSEQGHFFSLRSERKVKLDLDDQRLKISNQYLPNLPFINHNFWVSLNYRRAL
jgi:hypothetical protein